MLAAALLVLNHVAVIDVVRGAVERDRAVEIEGGRIRAVAPAASFHPPRGASVVDLPGRRLKREALTDSTLTQNRRLSVIICGQKVFGDLCGSIL